MVLKTDDGELEEAHLSLMKAMGKGDGSRQVVEVVQAYRPCCPLRGRDNWGGGGVAYILVESSLTHLDWRACATNHCKNSPTVGDSYSQPLTKRKSSIFHCLIPL